MPKKLIIPLILLALAIAGIMWLQDAGGPNGEGGTSIQAETAVCDQYVKSMNACLEKIPQTIRPGVQMTVMMMQSQWKASSKAPEARKVIEQTCKSAIQNAKQSMARYGCEF